MAATFIVEDGSGKSNANAYITEAEADQYNENHNANAVWIAAVQADKEKAIRLATQYLDTYYVWYGTRTNETQALDWPRYNVYDCSDYLIASDEIPQALKDACAELAIRSTNGTTLLPDLEDDGTIKREKNKVGSLENEVEYVDGKSPLTKYSMVDGIIVGSCLSPGSGSTGQTILERS